jgi:1-acyl-sn-glycerol-3-phosphate acyltransferase
VELRKLCNLCFFNSAATVMIQLDSPSHTSPATVKNTKVVPSVTSDVAPWLVQLVYPLGLRLVLPLFFGQIGVSGQEHLPQGGPVILAPVHRSRWDAILVPALTGRTVTGRDPRFMVSIDEVSGIQGWFIRRLGGFPVDPKHPSIATLRHGVELLQQGEMLVIFPEGNIFRDGYVHPLKAGLARIALSAEASQPGLGVKIIPIGICYSQTFPQWGCNVNFRIGSPLPVADYSKGSLKQNAKHLTQDLELALKHLSGQIREEKQRN